MLCLTACAPTANILCSLRIMHSYSIQVSVRICTWFLKVQHLINSSWKQGHGARGGMCNGRHARLRLTSLEHSM